MPATERVLRLRKQSLNAIPHITIERAQLMTEFYKNEHRALSIPMERALAFSHILENKQIWIGEDELIVGEKGPSPKATPTYPELCCHSLADLDILDSRPKTSFKVEEKVKAYYANTVIPYWDGRSLREVIFREMSEEWIAAYDCGVFTEFMEQRSPGHTVLDDKIYKKGFQEFITEINASIRRLDFLDDPSAYDKREELRAMDICAKALIRYAERHAEKAAELAAKETNPQRREELEQIAAICRRVPAQPPSTFWEALQYYWFVHLGVTIESNTWDAFNPGHLDQHLYPFYKRDVDAGKLNRPAAEELLQCFWIKFNNQPAPPKVGVTAEESSTYTDFALINVGGVKEDGSDAVNEVTFLILDVIEQMRLLQPSSCIQVSKKNPDAFVKRAIKIIRTGFGQPSVFNSDVIVQELVRQGKTIGDARAGGSSGCVEVGAFGKENYNLTGYLSMVKVFEITMHNGFDPLTGRKIGIETGDPRTFKTYDELFDAYKRQLQHFVEIKMRGNNVIERLYAKVMPSPFLSLLIDDCIQRGKDYNDGGARYNSTYIQGVGLGTLTNSLAAIKYHCFDQHTIEISELLDLINTDFEGHERQRQLLLNKSPHYGNDDDYADDVMVAIFNAYFNTIDGRPNTKGGLYRINLLPTTSHIYFGSKTGATPDGRKAYQPLSEGISPVQGSDRKGPTAVIRSAAKMDHVRTGGTLLNQKFTPSLLKDENGIEGILHLIRTYFKLDGHHIQFNVVDVETLHAAQKNPEQYRDLIVRVAGYSDYFCDLNETLQNEIITRTEHQSF